MGSRPQNSADTYSASDGSAAVLRCHVVVWAGTHTGTLSLYARKIPITHYCIILYQKAVRVRMLTQVVVLDCHATLHDALGPKIPNTTADPVVLLPLVLNTHKYVYLGAKIHVCSNPRTCILA